MPSIAKAVNEFTSEQVQQQAFRALIGALGGEPTSEETEAAATATAAAAPKRRATARRRARTKAATPAADAPAEGADTTAAAGVPRRKSAAAGVSIDKSLNLRPTGVESFEAFVESKNPTSDHERSLVAVYYLTQIAGVKATVDAVYTCYKDRKWRIPSDLRTSLRLTASKKGWINTENSEDIRVAVHGENHVDHDLPAKTAKA
jgi:hypothetical protein